MPDGYLISVGIKADFGDLKAEQKAAQDALKKAEAEWKAAYAELGKAAEQGSQQAVAALKEYETALNEAVSRESAATQALAAAQRAAFETRIQQQRDYQDWLAKGRRLAEQEATAAGHVVPQFAAASGALRTLEGNFTHNVRAAERFMTTTLGLGPVLQAAFPVIGAIAMGGALYELGKNAYEVYQKFISLDDVTKKLEEDFKKLQEHDLLNVHSIETAKARLDEATASAATLREEAEKIHGISLKGFFGDLISGNTSGMGMDLSLLFGSRKLAEEGSKKTLESIALTQKEVELQHQLRVAEIEAQFAGASKLDKQQKVNSELEKELALHKEAQRYSRELDRAMGNKVAPDQGDALRSAQDKAARAKAAAELSDIQRKAHGDMVMELVKDDEDAAKEQKRITEEVQQEAVRGLKEEEQQQKQAARAELEAQRERKRAYEENLRVIEETTRAKIANASADIDRRMDAVRVRGAEGMLSPEREAALLESLSNQKLQIENHYYEQLKSLYLTDSIEWTKIEDQRLAAVRKSAEEQAKIQENLERRQLRSYQNITNTINREFLSAFNRIALGQEGVAQGSQRMAARMILSFADAMMQQVLLHAQAKEIQLLREAAHWIKVNVLHMSSAATQQATDTAANATKLTSTISTNIAAAASNAAVAATGAYAATAMIPFVGPEIAPAAAAATYAGAMGFGALASASGGWDRVPSDTIAAIHKDEMVMSAPLANGLRAMISGGGGRPSVNYAPTFYGAGNTREIQKTIRQSSREVTAAVKRGIRNGHF